MDFIFEDIDEDTSGFLYGNALYGNTVYGESYEPSGQKRYATMRRYLESGSSVQTGSYIDGSQWFNERLPNTSPASQLVAWQPPDNLAESGKTKPFWGVITGGTDLTSPDVTWNRIQFQVFVVATFDEYQTRQEVEDEAQV